MPGYVKKKVQFVNDLLIVLDARSAINGFYFCPRFICFLFPFLMLSNCKNFINQQKL